MALKVVKINMEVTIDDSDNFSFREDVSDGFTVPKIDKGKVVSYLNNKLYNDPEFFGEFQAKNIVEIREFN